jgi:hypothetical protein
LEISKEKQTKIKEVFTNIQEFLVGESMSQQLTASDKSLSSGFSKEENDLLQKKESRFLLRQKLMRELYLVESLVHIIYLPFSYGDFILSLLT